jgi:hypothetical protein
VILVRKCFTIYIFHLTLYIECIHFTVIPSAKLHRVAEHVEDSCHLLAANLAALNLLTGRVAVGCSGGNSGSSEECSSTFPNTYKTNTM